MESEPDKNNSFKTSSKEEVLRMLAYNSSSSSSSKKSEESKKTTSNSNEISEDDIERPASSPSPDPNCAICLQPIQNKSFANGCCHTFCFTCLMKWSDEKAECPLCKQQFQSILYNIREDQTYDEYVVGSKTEVLLPSTSSGIDEPNLPFSPLMSPSRAQERSEYLQSQIDSHRMIFAPHSGFITTEILSNLPCPFRRRVYEKNLWVNAPLGRHTRLATPEFFLSNPDCVRRLIPWLNRELVSFWHNNESHVNFILELIVSLLQRFDINSQEFLIHIEPYMGRHTHHFIHELHSFAISPYDMESYDEHADYGLISHSDDDEHASPDSDVIAIFTGENPSLARQNQERQKNMVDQALNHLKKIVKNNNGNSWSNPGPSTSGFRSNVPLIDANISTYTPISDVELMNEDEIQFLDVVNPQAEQTPELVELSSDEEVPVIDISSDEDNFSLACTPSQVTFPSAAISIDTSSDEECDLDNQPSTSRDILTTNEVFAKNDINVEENQEELYHDSSDTELYSDVPMSDVEHEVKKDPLLASAIVRPWLRERESSHKVFVPQIKRRCSSSYLDDSLSESSDNEGKNSPKKLKLQNVVACFSIDHSGSKSGRRSSSKEKKKEKKHKHIRKHRYNRIVSDSDSS